MNRQYYKEKVNSYVEKLMNNLWNETLMGNTQIIFFNTKNSETFSEYMDSYLQNITLETNIFQKRMSDTKFSRPYYPFLDFIKGVTDVMNKKEKEDFVEKANVYYFQQSVFLSYFCGETVQRKEEVILEELVYEKDRMLQSILNLYFSISKNTPSIVLIEDIHFAKQSTLELIKYLIKTKEKSNIFFIFSFDKEYQFESQERQKLWDEFIQCVHTYHSIIDVEIPKDINEYNYVENEKDKILKIEEIIDLSTICFHFFALQEAKEYITTVYNEKIVGNASLVLKNYIKMFHLLGDIHYYLDENDNALRYYNSLLNFCQKSKNIKEISYCYERMGYIYWRKGNIKRAEQLGVQSLKYALELEDKILILNANSLFFLIGHRGREKNIEKSQSLYYQSINIAKMLDMQNILAYYYTQPYAIAVQNEEECLKLSDLGISIAMKYDNKYRLSAAYHIRGIFHKIKGAHDKGIMYYEKSKKLKLELGYELEISYIYNGIGFYYFIKGNYNEANSYYCKALEYLRNLKSYNEIGNTLFNMANNYFFSLQHKLSIKCLEKLIFLVNILKMESITYHTLFGIYSLMGLNYCQIGDISKAYNCMIKIKEIESPCSMYDDIFFVKLFKALLYKIEGDYEKSTYYFESAIPFIQKLKYMAPRFYYEYGLMKKEQGKKEDAENLFKISMKYCEELEQYSFYYDLLLNELGISQKVEACFKLPSELSDLQWVLDSIKQEVTIHTLHKRINEINFLNILQEIIGRQKTKESLIENVMNLIHDTFFLEYSFFYLKEEKEWKCIYFSQTLEMQHLELFNEIESLAQKQKITIIQNMNENFECKNLRNIFSSIVNIPLIYNDEIVGNILCATKKDELIFNSDDTKILSITAKQLLNALKKIKIAEEILQKDKELYEANESERLKTEFLCNLSHEFRTPLNVILGALQLLRLNVNDHKESKYLGVMKQNCYRLLRLINNLIDISKIDSGFYKTSLENHNIVNLVEEITLSVVPYAEMKGISVQFDTNVEEKIMGCDVDQMERVILNLLSNSIKFTKPGDKITVNFYDKGNKILIIIKDTGIGIPKNKLNMIFQRFGQVDKSLARNHEGSGIGLSLVKSIVEMWGGNISIESEYGKGSTFIIEVPVTILPSKNAYMQENDSISLNLVERTQVEFSDIYF